MFWRWLATIRQKPKAVRDQYAFGVAVTFTALVLAVWTFSLPARFSDSPEELANKAPFTGLFSQISGGVSSIRGQVGAVFSSYKSESVEGVAATSSEKLQDAADLWLQTDTPVPASSTEPSVQIVEIRVATSTSVQATGTSPINEQKPTQ